MTPWEKDEALCLDPKRGAAMSHHHHVACAVLNLALAVIHGLALLPLGAVVIAILLFVVITTPSNGWSPLHVGRSGIHLKDGWGTAMNNHHLVCAVLYLALAIVNAAALLPFVVIAITILLFVVITTPSDSQSPLRVGRSGIHLKDGWGTAMNHHHHLACALLYLALAIVNAAALLLPHIF
jgi:hypothetical protein